MWSQHTPPALHLHSLEFRLRGRSESTCICTSRPVLQQFALLDLYFCCTHGYAETGLAHEHLDCCRERLPLRQTS